jgi:hypothetical protein
MWDSMLGLCLQLTMCYCSESDMFLNGTVNRHKAWMPYDNPECKMDLIMWKHSVS